MCCLAINNLKTTHYFVFFVATTKMTFEASCVTASTCSPRYLRGAALV